MHHNIRPLLRRGAGLALALCLTLGAAPLTQAEEPKSFSDVGEGDWFYSFVSDLSAQGVISGYPDGTFQPQNDVTVGEALSLVLLAAGHEMQQPTGEHWSSGLAAYAVKNAYCTSALTQDLDAPITRLDVAQLAAKALKLVPPKGYETAFADTDDGYVNALYQKNILAGELDGDVRIFKPDAPITRAEVSAIVWNIRNTDVHAGQIETEYYYVDVLEGVEGNGYDPECFQLDEKGRMDYIHPDVETMQGVDVASFQGDIDWEKVKADGIDFAMIRVGGRGYTEGKLYDDKKFEENIQGALEAGLEVGVYFFSQAVNLDEALEEAQYVLEELEPYAGAISFPVVFDWEDFGNSTYRTYRLDSDVLGACANLFCDMMKAAGYQPMIYFNRYGGYRSYDLRQVVDYQFWFAQYISTTDVPTFYYDFDMWQYSDKGKVDGIPAEVDLNLYLIKK